MNSILLFKCERLSAVGLSNTYIERTFAARLGRAACAARICVDRRPPRLDYATEGARSAKALTGGCGVRTGQTTSALKVVGGRTASRVSNRPRTKHYSPTFFGAQITEMAATEELSGILSRRQEINDKLEEGLEVKPKYKFVNVYTEFHEFSRKEIKQYEETFNKFDEGHDGFLDLNEVKRMMERLGAPQTHLGLKAMISEVDEDGDSKISFREFLLIYRKARAGELETDSGLEALARLTEINVDQVGVNGAKNFFEAKIEELAKSNKFHNEIIQEQEEKRREAEEKALRMQRFKEKAALFQH